MIYGLISEYGHFGYAAYFMILELLHREGIGDILQISPQQLCFNLRSKPKVVRNYLVSIRERSGNKIITNWDDSRNIIIIEVKNFREWQHNLKPKRVSNGFEKRIEKKERENESREDTPNPPKGAAGFDDFWKAYPRKDSKQSALKSWGRISNIQNTLPTILAAVAKQKLSPSWTKDGGQFIPMPSTWLNQRRWEDQGTSIVDPSAPVNMRDHLYARDRDEAQIS